MKMGMIDITEKPVIQRKAIASGIIYLSENTISEIRAGNIRKGNPIPIAEVAGMNAAKQTHLLIPHCHQILLDTVVIDFEISDCHIEARCTVKAQARTGVEMEAIVGVSMALNCIWDMVKYLEKDADGQYPSTRISDIRVIEKIKQNEG